MSMDIDAAYEEFQRKERVLATALAECESEQAAGRTGLDAYRRAKSLNDELTAFAARLTATIEEALAGL